MNIKMLERQACLCAIAFYPLEKADSLLCRGFLMGNDAQILKLVWECPQLPHSSGCRLGNRKLIGG
jgi:hypothetical protein